MDCFYVPWIAYGVVVSGLAVCMSMHITWKLTQVTCHNFLNVNFPLPPRSLLILKTRNRRYDCNCEVVGDMEEFREVLHLHHHADDEMLR